MSRARFEPRTLYSEDTRCTNWAKGDFWKEMYYIFVVIELSTHSNIH